ncbi:MAG TPA: hypothetical protein VJ140_10420 [Actinomycetota bacterium]|nr:hypothetical protein [Actinomycetota bacterium]
MDLPLLPGGRRLDWERLSAPVREALQARLGSPVIHAATQPGGFSPGLAARLRLAAAAEHGHDDLAGLDPWARRHLDRLVAVEQTWPAAAAGGTLLALTCGPTSCCSPRPG